MECLNDKWKKNFEVQTNTELGFIMQVEKTIAILAKQKDPGWSTRP